LTLEDVQSVLGTLRVIGQQDRQELKGGQSMRAPERPDHEAISSLQRFAGNAAAAEILAGLRDPLTRQGGLRSSLQRCGTTPCDCPPKEKREMVPSQTQILALQRLA